MKVLVASSAGFCFGVKRAINMAMECAESADGNIYTYGPIIHNPQVVAKLEDSNIQAKKRLSEMDGGGTVIIRSHGVKVEDYKEAEDRGLSIIDATCPFVKKSQDLVAQLTREGYMVIVVGEKDHPEVQGVLSYGGGDVRVAYSVDELSDLPGDEESRIGIVAQTTLSIKKLQEITSFCLTRSSDVKVFNTICDATSLRQTESVEIAKRVDVMIIVGGRNSANTNRLAELCVAIQPNSHHIEVSGEISGDWFAGAKSAGITAGASTPSWLINEVVKRVEEIGETGH